MAKVTMKSTKEVMMTEIERLTEEVATVAAGNKTVVVAQEEKRVATVKDSAKKIVDMQILAPSVIEGYSNVQEAIVIATKELEEITGIKNAIIELEAVLLAGEKLSADQKAELVAQNAKLKEEAVAIIAEKTAAIKQLDIDYDERKATIEKNRKRESEEYTYTKERNRQKEEDEWADVKATREKALQEKEEDLTERANDIEAREEEISILKLQVANIPALVEEATEAAEEKVGKQLAREKAIEIAGIKKNAEWEIKMSNMEKERSVEDLGKANDRIASLEAKLEAAYASMNTLATTTVQSTGGVKILETGKDK